MMKTMAKECSKMDSRSNVISEGNTNNRDSTTNVVSEGDTGSMEGTMTSNPLAVVSNYREYDIAISNFKKTLGIAKETGDKYCEMQANVNLCNAYALTKQFDKVVSTAKECIQIIKEISAKKAAEVDDCSSLHIAGICIKDTCLGNVAATAYFRLGSAEAHLSLFEDSLDSFHKCAAVAAAIGDQRNEVMSCYGIAKLYEEKGQWDDVIKFSRRYIDKVSLFCGKEMKIEAYLRLATAFFHTCSYEEVVVYGNKYIETMGCSWDTSGCRIECVRTLSILVQSCFWLNNYDETINYGRKYLQVAVNTGTKEAEMQAHYFLAAVYHQLHQIDRSCNHTTNGMAIAEELKDDTRMGMFKPLLSVFYALVGMREKAFLLDPGIKTLFEVPTSPRQELEVLVKAVKAGDVNQQLQSQFRLYNYHKSKHQFERAMHCLNLSMGLIPNGHDMKLFYYAPIAEMYIGMRKYEEGLKYCMDGLREVTECKNEKILFDFFFYISQLYTANGEWKLAEKYLEKAVQCFETLYGSVGSNEDFKMSMIDHYNTCFRFLSLVYVQTNRKKEALLVLDKCRARALKEILVAKYGIQENKEASDTKPIDIEALVSDNKFAILYYSVCGFGNALAFLVGHNCFEASVQQLFFDENKYNQIIDKMFDEIEVLQKVNCEDRTLDSKQDIKQQKQEEEAYDEREILLAEIRKRKFFVHGKTIMMECQGEKRRATVLEFLYYLILGEGQLLIKQSEIIVIPDGSLCKIPFAALQDPSTGKYLSETKRIRLAPSLAVLKLLSENAEDYHCSGDALVIGDPHVGKVMFDGKEDEISRLEKAQIEAKVVARHLNVEPLLGDKATKPAVLEKLRQGVSVVHIAAHGILSKATIVLAPSPEIRKTKPIPDEEDYMLTTADVQQAQVRAQLVVLSCCHSGRGEIRAEGVVGMCRAFLASGARAVVASLWAIDDEATLEFMVEFYWHLRIGKSAGTSLQLTMNEMRKTDPRPMYWAPFFLMGDDVTIKFT